MSLRANSPAPNDQVQRVWTKRRLRLVRHWASAGSTKWIKARYSAASIFVVLMFAVLACALVAAFVSGAQTYRHIQNDSSHASQLRQSTTLLANAVRSADATQAVRQGEGPQGAALVLVETLDSGSYETRLYLHDGWIVQEYVPAAAPVNPEGATRLVRSESFWFDIRPDSIELGCDGGQTVVALRSHQATASLGGDQNA